VAEQFQALSAALETGGRADTAPLRGHSVLRPCLVAVGGFSGSGKSTVARGLAAHLGLAHVRTDALRKHLAGVPAHEKAPPSAYTTDMSGRTYALMHALAERLLHDGLPVLLDATFTLPASREAVAELARHAGVPFLGLWCHVPEEEARRRIRGRTGDVSDADEVILNSQLARGAGPMAWPTLDGRGTPGDVLARAVDLTAPLHR
jgi:hypothetical protein